nr:cytochrome c oxidase subunit 3 [Azohydromonas caseinilytica]
MKMGRQTELARARVDGAALDVSHLPSFGFSHRSLMWWGTLGLMAIEGTVFALAIGAYFYLRAFASRWPMEDQPPALLWGTVNTLLFLASLWPAHYAKRAAEALDLRKVRLGLLMTSAAELAILGVRALEFQTLNCRWDGSAYGSIVWMLMGLHTLHLITDAYDTLVLTVLMHTGPIEGKRYVDVSENSLYWYFVVWSWLPLYAVIYGVPRLG